MHRTNAPPTALMLRVPRAERTIRQMIRHLLHERHPRLLARRFRVNGVEFDAVPFGHGDAPRFLVVVLLGGGMEGCGIVVVVLFVTVVVVREEGCGSAVLVRGGTSLEWRGIQGRCVVEEETGTLSLSGGWGIDASGFRGQKRRRAGVGQLDPEVLLLVRACVRFLLCWGSGRRLAQHEGADGA